MAAEHRPRSLNHFAGYRFTEAYWRLSGEEQHAQLQRWVAGLQGACERLYLYQVFPTEAGIDVLVWSAAIASDPEDGARFFAAYARAANAQRSLIEPRDILWGYTGSSVYSKARSTQEVDPFTSERQRYLVVYPFAKTAGWYLTNDDVRQAMMNEHIRLGKQFPHIRQLLLYSFGLQDHEFVVVYETDDLLQFSDLVRQLRSTEARRYTERDSPLHTAVHQSLEEVLSLWRAS